MDQNQGEPHTCVAHKHEGKVTIICTCQARWVVTQAEYDAGIDHINDHRAYAMRTPTKVD